MKQILLLAAFSTALFLNPGQLCAKSSREPPKELLEQQQAKPKPLASGSWYLRGETLTTVNDKSPISFIKKGASENDIVHADAGFKLPNNGVYMVTFGVTTLEAANMFELQLSGKRLPGGKLFTILDGTIAYATGTLTVMFPAKAGERLQLVNVSGNSAKIGACEKEAISAYISILQVR